MAFSVGSMPELVKTVRCCCSLLKAPRLKEFVFLNQVLGKIIGQQYWTRRYHTIAQSTEGQTPHNQPLVMIVYYIISNTHQSQLVLKNG